MAKVVVYCFFSIIIIMSLYYYIAGHRLLFKKWVLDYFTSLARWVGKRFVTSSSKLAVAASALGQLFHRQDGSTRKLPGRWHCMVHHCGWRWPPKIGRTPGVPRGYWQLELYAVIAPCRPSRHAMMKHGDGISNYRRTANFREENGFRPLPGEVCQAARRATMACWSSRLETPRFGFVAVKALQPVILE